MAATIRIGTRDSALALWQSNYIKNEITRLHPGYEIELLPIKTKGDITLDSPLSKIGDKGLFTKELEYALLDGSIDLAVHSLKDLQTELPEGLTIGAVARREDVRDVFIAHPSKKYGSLDDLPVNAAIATGSLRRASQLLAWRPALRVHDIRGNINTRLRKLDDSDWDGMVLAAAGLLRLGLHERMTQIIDTSVILPAVGQGALAVETRAGDAAILKLLEPLDDPGTRRAVTAERALLRRLEGGCQIPVGAWARVSDGILTIEAAVGSLDGRTLVRTRTSGDPAHAGSIGESLAETLLRMGADAILAEIRRTELHG
jgi:hydroxymethylbilane synthase